MTEGKIAVCPQCGKKFKLKEGFSAASFSCTGCSATVWVEGKPPAPSGKRKSAPGRRKRTGGGARRGRAAAPVRGRGGRGAPDEGGEGEEGGRYSRYQKKPNNTNMILAVVGIIAIAGIAVGFMMMSKDDAPDPNRGKTAQMPGSAEDLTRMVEEERAKAATEGQPETPAAGATDPGSQTPAAEGEVEDKGTGLPDLEDDPSKPTKSLQGGKQRNKKGKIVKSKYDPPADIPHLEDTAPELREKIDTLIATMMDYEMGRDSTDAKYDLINIGKPAFPRILASMAKIRDTITDVDNDEERLIESSLKLADEALREMDGYLTNHAKPVLRPGSSKRYIAYICRMHYKRWIRDLQKMPQMPGPYDPSVEFEGGDEPDPEEH